MKRLLTIIILLSNILFADGLLKTSGKKIINEKGEDVFLKGMGLGGWLLPEGYMLQTSNFANAFWEMKNKIIEVVGEENANKFWSEYRKNFVTRKDIEQLSKLGFNSVRVALHYEFFIKYTPTGYEFINNGFEIIDSLLSQCADNKIYLILDLHAAPGGQSANNISDYNPSLLSLWESDKNKTMTIELWRKFAERYKNSEWIGGYDILNEPAWNLGTNNIPLKDLYLKITNAIRSVDTNHIIFVEGNWYATDFSGLTPPWDNNMVYSFHKYWNSNDQGSIGNYLSLRNNYNIPLWLGESGENSNVWFTDCISLMEANDIGWCWWTLKKFETIAGPYSVPINSDYENLLKFWRGEGSKPSVENAMNGLMKMAEGLKLEKIIFRSDVIDAMMRQPKDKTLKKYFDNKIPGIIFAVNYDLGVKGIAYNDVDYQNIGSGNWNNGWQLRNDGVDIEKCSDVISNGYNVGWIENSENLNYTIDVLESAKYSIDIRIASTSSNGYIGISFDNNDQIMKQVSNSGGWQNWSTINFGNIDLTKGTHNLKLKFYFNGFNVNYLEFKNIGTMDLNEKIKIPEKFQLYQNYPNPFNGETVINFSLPKNDFVKLKIYDLLGKEIQTLFNQEMKAGSYSIKLNSDKLQSGTYFYKIFYSDKQITKKMVLIK